MREVKPNVFIYDFGQEISGYCRLKIKGTPAGTVVRLRHAEKIGPDGMLDVRSLWGVEAQENYILDGKQDRVQSQSVLCHWTHSGVGEWLWRNVAGLNSDSDDPGYRSMTIRLQPTKEVHSCRSRYLSVRGAIEIEWAWRGGEFRLDIAVPVGARAKVFFPVGDQDSIRESSTPAKKASGVEFLSMSGSGPVFQVESGRYNFTTTYTG
jgi:hypothetical protein